MTGGRLGILGGTFDPPHYGHLVLAENGRVQLQLDKVLFVPAGEQPLKPAGVVASPRQRAAMVEAAIEDNPGLAVSLVDLQRPGPHYTVETLTLLQGLYPGAELYFLMGGDSLDQFLAWRDPEGILRQARLVVMKRPGYEPDLRQLDRALPGVVQRVIWLDGVSLGIASSDLRRRVGDRLPLRYLVPPSVEEYIQRHHLYIGESG